MRTWQVSAGAEGRNYEWAFLRYGIAFAGGSANEKALQAIRAGDVVILKHGVSQISAVGVAVEKDGVVGGLGDKPWLEDFDGWGLPAYCHVDWHVPEEPVPTKGLGRGAVQGVNKQSIIEQALDLLDQIPPLPGCNTEPVSTRPVTDGAMLSSLIREGLSPAQADDLTAAVSRIRLLATYYHQETDWSISEHEVRTFLILPLLTALGWSEQQIRIEYPTKAGKLDVVCFNKPIHRAEESDCVLILESKNFKHGLDVAHNQAKRYATALPQAKAVVASNGYCYKVYLRSDKGSFEKWPDAYINLLKPRDRYPLDPSKGGAVETLRLLLPHRYN